MLNRSARAVFLSATADAKPKWSYERIGGRAYSVRLSAGSMDLVLSIVAEHTSFRVADRLGAESECTITRKQRLLLITSMQLALFAHARVQRLHYKREGHSRV